MKRPRLTRRTATPDDPPADTRAGASGAPADPGFDPGHITPEAVAWAYRLFLDREPESAAAAEAHVSLETTARLRHFLMSGPEFTDRNPRPGTPVLRGDEAALEIEDVTDPERTAVLYEHIRRTWHGLGESVPHYSVLTSPDYLPEMIDEKAEWFYGSGEGMVERLVAVLTRVGVDTSGLRSCLEFGCGVGRVTIWLAERFDEVVGCDISETHLALAAETVAERGLDNVTLRHLAAVADLADLPPVDLAYSVIVLQHNPPPVIRVAIGALLDALNPGGIAFFQVPTYIHGYRFRLDDYLADEVERAEIEMHPLPQRDVFEIVRARGCELLEVIDDDETGDRATVVSNTFVVRKPA